MSVIKNKLELVARVTYETLLRLGVVEKNKNNDLDGANDQASSGIIKIRANSLFSTIKYIEIITTEVSEDATCMITLCDDKDNTLANHVFKYDDDDGNKDDVDNNSLELNSIKFPLNWTLFQNEHKNQVVRLSNVIMVRLKLQSMVLSFEKSGISNKNDSEPVKIDKIPVESNTTILFGNGTSSKHSNVELPKFEDEYEINEPSATFHSEELQERYLPARGGSTYGSNDLYPMGQKNPLGSNLGPFGPPSNNRNDGSNDNRGSPGQGGMIFDPFGQNRDEVFRDTQNRRGPGWVPGSKYDDPFGNAGGFNGMGGSGFPGSGSGSGFGFL
ncbi:Fub1p PWA37_004671 [Arxiozyma heterogenica]|uniref:PI31 proteasome regulator C-terminal domain-containing protein n=1 Tax=Arxiozyma heterogenica TaxID=278026 RepID=A0AAN8A9D1_9SACH|nr:hypothetical protein RI543_000952 [Kazachstania heterogenica]